MVIKKKTLYIVLPILILTILISFILIYLMGWFGNSPKLNRYESLIDNCTVEKKLFNIELKCDALVYKTEVRDSKNCLDLRVINKEQTDISELEVCEKEKVLDISDPVLDTDMKIPMHMVFKYRYLPPLSYGISNISMELMDDNTIIDILLKLQEKGINIKDVRIQENEEMDKRGYYYEETESLEGNKYVGMITFFNTKINEVSISVGSNLMINMSLGINGKQKEYQFIKDSLTVYMNSDFSEKIVINKDNLFLFNKEQSYFVNFVYIPKGSKLTSIALNNICQNNDLEISLKELCYKKNQLESLRLNTSIEEYVSDDYLDKLTINYLY